MSLNLNNWSTASHKLCKIKKGETLPKSVLIGMYAFKPAKIPAIF